MTSRPAGLSGRLSSMCRLPSCLALCLVLCPATALAGTLSGRVLDPDDRPVARAQVIVVHDRTIIVAVPSSAEGRFGPVSLEPATYELLVAAPGFQLPPTTVTIDGTGAQDLDLRLTISARNESVVVSAAQVETPASHLAGQASIITRATLDDLQLETVADALHQIPGFSIVSSGGRGAITSLFPRGGESDYTLVLVDGIVQNVFGGGFDAAHLATANVDRVEVVRGPQSALYGAGAIGGIVQIVTSNGGSFHSSGQVETGGHGTTSGSGSITGSRGAWTFGGGVDWLQSDGDRRTLASGATVSNDDYARAAGSASVAWSDSATRRVRVDLRGGRNERGFPGPYGSDPLGLYGGIDTMSRGVNETMAAGVQARFAQGSRVFHHASLNWANDFGRYQSPFGSSTNETRRVTGRYQLDVAHARLPASAGAEWLGERADNTFITGEAFTPIPIERTSTGLFVETRPVLSDALSANVGLRVERIERRSLETDGFSRPAFPSQTVWSANPRLSVTWLAHEGGSPARPWMGTTRVRVGAGTGIKAPTAFEIAYTDNPDLQPERSRSLDVGVEQAFASSRLVADATWFVNRYDDLIVSVGQALSGASRYQTDNIANARARGLELGASWRPAAAWAIRGSWSWLDTEILGVDAVPTEAPAPYVVGDRLLRRPRVSGSLDIRWAGTTASAFLALSGRGSMLDLEPNFASELFENGGFVTATVGGAIRVHRTVEVYGRLVNAFDRQFEDVFGYPSLGRTGSIGVRVTTGR